MHVHSVLPCHFYIIRILVACILVAPLALPAIFINAEMVGSPIVILFTNVNLPLIIGAFLLICGPYDKLVAVCANKKSK